MLLSDFRLSIENKLGVQAAGTERTLLDSYINDAVLRVCVDLVPNIVGSTVTLSNGVRFYNLTTTLVLVDVYHDGQPPVTRLSVHEMLEYRTANPGNAQYITHYAHAGGVFYVHPIPTAASTTVSIMHQAVPTALSAPGDSPATAANGGVPNELHRGIELYALYQAADMVDDEKSEHGNAYLQQYYDWLQRRQMDLGRRGGQWGRHLSSHPMPETSMPAPAQAAGGRQ